MVAESRARNVFLMEAMWTRFFPAMAKLRTLTKDGTLGDVRLVQADFGFGGKHDPKGRLLNPELGGGALLDVGVYPISLAFMLLGAPQVTHSLTNLGETGVDMFSCMLFGYAGGQMASLNTAIDLTTPHEAIVMGTEARVKIADPWWIPQVLTLIHNNGQEEIL